MPYGDPDHTDPLTLHGVVVETDDPTCVQEMAACFIEEYLRSDFAPAEILRLFRNPQYAAAHMAYRVIGEEGVREILELGLLRRGPRREAASSGVRGTSIALPVLERAEI